MNGLRLVGGGIDRNGSDVTVSAPTPDMRSQALLSGKTPHGVLLGKERNADQAQRCAKCRFSTDIVVDVLFVKDEGFPIRICRTCAHRNPGDPLKITIQLAD